MRKWFVAGMLMAASCVLAKADVVYQFEAPVEVAFSLTVPEFITADQSFAAGAPGVTCELLVAGLTCVGISFDVEFNVAEYWFSRIQMDYVNTEALSGSSWYYFDPGAFAASGTYPDFFGSGYLTVTGDGEGGGDVSTPEPSTLALLAVPLLAIFGLRRRAARQS